MHKVPIMNKPKRYIDEKTKKNNCQSFKLIGFSIYNYLDVQNELKKTNIDQK